MGFYAQQGKARDCCEFYTRKIRTLKHNGEALEEYIQDRDKVATALDEWLREYVENKDSLSVARKEELQSMVFAHSFYLILFELKNWKLPSIIFEEAVQNASIAVVSAMDKFDPSKNARFSTFLVQWQFIKGAVREAIDSHSTVRVPDGVRKRTARKQKEKLRLGEELDATPFGTPQIDSYDTPTHPEVPEPGGEFVYLENMDYSNDDEASSDPEVENIIFTKEVRKMLELALEHNKAGLTENEKITVKHKHGLMDTPVLRTRKSREC